MSEEVGRELGVPSAHTYRPRLESVPGRRAQVGPCPEPPPRRGIRGERGRGDRRLLGGPRLL